MKDVAVKAAISINYHMWLELLNEYRKKSRFKITKQCMYIPRSFRHCGHKTTKGCSVQAKSTLALKQIFESSGLYMRLEHRGEGQVDWLISCGDDALHWHCKAWFTNTMTSIVTLWGLSFTERIRHFWLVLCKTAD